MNGRIDISGITLETKRMVLRPWRETDLADFYAYSRVDGVGQMAGWSPHKSIAESKNILSHFIQGKKTFALEYRGKVIGSLGIEEYNEDHYPELAHLQGREIGYVLSKDYWGQGLMPEAVAAVIPYLFDQVGLDFILVGHFDWNRQSRRVIEKCGFQYIKTCPYKTRFDTVENSVEYILYTPRRIHFMDGYTPSNEEDLVQEIYRRYDENTRLTKSQAAQVEFLTNVRYIEKYLHPGDRILDVGAGTGAYSLYFSRKGYQVSALELSDSNLAAFRQNLTPEDTLEVVRGNALDLSRYQDGSFDCVLLFGPLYHLHSPRDQKAAIQEAKRVLKPHGILFFAFISNDIVILTMQQTHPEYLLEGDYDKDTFTLTDFPFVFHRLEDCRALLQDCGIEILHQVASDGLSEVIKDTIDAMDAPTFQQYMRYHFYVCEKPECLGMSNHWLFIGKAVASDCISSVSVL